MFGSKWVNPLYDLLGSGGEVAYYSGAYRLSHIVRCSLTFEFKAGKVGKASLWGYWAEDGRCHLFRCMWATLCHITRMRLLGQVNMLQVYHKA